MKFNLLIAGACALALTACGDNTPNPEMLKGANFVSAQPGGDITLRLTRLTCVFMVVL